MNRLQILLGDARWGEVARSWRLDQTTLLNEWVTADGPRVSTTLKDVYSVPPR